MEWYMFFLVIIGSSSMTQAACVLPIKFYIDCGQTRTASAADLFCRSHQMTVVNLTNGTSLASDIALLNTTLRADNCDGYFWFSSGSQTGLYANVDSLGNLLGSLLGAVLNLVLCLIPFLCPAATTITPLNNAFTICTRPTQQRVVQKCSTVVQRSDMQQFVFKEISLSAGVLSSFAARSSMACSGFCSSDDTCVGMSYIDGTCTLYM